MTRESSVVVGCIALVAALAWGGAAAQGTPHPDLSGRWQLNVELSEDAQAKLDKMQSSQGGGGHGPGRHGLGRIFGGLFGGGQQAQMEEARTLLLAAPASLTVKHDGDQVVISDGHGRVRTLTANGRKEKIEGRDVLTRWDQNRLVSETTLRNSKMTETYERANDAPRMVLTTRVDMGRGHEVSVRRVYDAAGR